MVEIAYEIALYLQVHSIGTLGVNLFYGQFVDQPADQITVRLASGYTSIFSPSTKQIVVVMVRNTSLDTGKQKVNGIIPLLNDKQDFLTEVVGATHHVGYSQSTRLPIYVGKDINGRHLFTAEFEMNVNGI